MQQLHSHRCELPQELIERALALTGRMIEDMEEPEFVHRTQGFPELYNGRLNWFLSIEKFCFYLLSPAFIEKYREDIDGLMFCSREFGEAISEHQKGNSQPLIDLLSKI